MIIYESSYFGIAFFIQKNIFQFQITMTNFILNKETMEIEKKMNHQKKNNKNKQRKCNHHHHHHRHTHTLWQ